MRHRVCWRFPGLSVSAVKVLTFPPDCAAAVKAANVDLSKFTCDLDKSRHGFPDSPANAAGPCSTATRSNVRATLGAAHSQEGVPGPHTAI